METEWYDDKNAMLQQWKHNVMMMKTHCHNYECEVVHCKKCNGTVMKTQSYNSENALLKYTLCHYDENVNAMPQLLKQNCTLLQTQWCGDENTIVW